MKENNELERSDIVIDRDMEVDYDIGHQITCYLETWFDVDKKFGIDTAADNGTWLNMYAKYNPFADTLRIECEISRDSGSSYFDYEPTENESQLIKAMIAEKLMPNTNSAKSISTAKIYREIPTRQCTIFILPPSMATNTPHSSSTVLRETGIGRQHLPHFVCSVTWFVLSKTAWRMSAEAEKTASTASCGEKSRRKNRLTDSNNSTGRLRIHFMRNLKKQACGASSAGFGYALIYFWFLLLGLSGIVLFNLPESSNGFRIL